MRILHITESFWPTVGGVQTMVERLARAQAERGDAVTVLVAGPHCELPAHETHDDISIRRVDYRSAVEARDTAVLRNIRRQVADLRRSFLPDVTHLHLSGPGAGLHLQTADVAPGPWIATVHTQLPAAPVRSESMLGRVLTTATAVVTISERGRRTIRRMVPDAADVRCIYNGVPAAGRASDAPPEDPPILMCLGRLAAEKGFDLAIAAFALLPGPPGCRLWIAGEGHERQNLEEQAARLGIADRVRFLGPVAPAAVPGILQQATVILMPSRAEAFGLVAVEAALARRPVVARNVGGLVEVVVDGRTGLVVDSSDPGEFATAVHRLLSDPADAAAMGIRAAALAEDRFALDRFVNSYDNAYHSSATWTR